MSTVPLEQAPLYRDPSRGADERAADLLRRMTREEKVAQLGSVWVFQLTEGDRLSESKAVPLLGRGLGQVTRISGASSLGASGAARLANEIQRFLLERTRLGIPAIVHEEVCSGLMASQSTVFPQAIGVASTWDPGLAEAMADVVRVQMRAVGAHQGLSPVLDVCRDPRWGRTEETFGEDPHLVAQMGLAMVRGLQGDSPTNGVVATGKHFVGYGASEGGLNWAPAHIPRRELREVYLHPFEAAVKLAGLRSVMNGYHEIDGVPGAADRELLTEILRESWEFQGCVVSDYFAVRQLSDYHHLAEDAPEAAAIALEAGLDVELPSTDCYGQPLLQALESGRLSEATLDDAVSRVLLTKLELGLFERPFVDPDVALSVMSTPFQLELAGRLARKSIVLLRNDGILPLSSQLESIAVIGPNAHESRNLFGDYTYPAHVESLLEMRDHGNVFSIPLPDEADLGGQTIPFPTVFDVLEGRFGDKVRLARGCGISEDSTEGFAEAVALAADSDVAVLILGDKSGLTEDCTSGESRDRHSLDLPGAQEELLAEVVKTGTPVVLVLVAGRPTGSVRAHESCAAVVTAWLPGQEGAAAIVDVLAGEVNPGGKLPITQPRTVGQIPTYYGHKVSGGRSYWKGDYVDGPVAPLYPFGHGLSYTTFELGSPSVAPDVVTWNDEVSVEIEVANTGQRDGEEVVQLYVRDPQASVTRPVLELKGFTRVEVVAGASKRITFRLPVGQLGFYDRHLRYVVEPGEIEVMVGTSSQDLVHAGMFTVIADPSGPPVKRFEGTVAVADLGTDSGT